VESSCRFVEFEDVRIAAAVRRDFGTQEFLEDLAFGVTREKLRPGVAERMGHDPLGGRFLWRGRANIGVEIEANRMTESDGQVLKRSLGNEATLNVPFVSA
jgi:hypothetical protein